MGGHGCKRCLRWWFLPKSEGIVREERDHELYAKFVVSFYIAKTSMEFRRKGVIRCGIKTMPGWIQGAKNSESGMDRKRNEAEKK